MKYASNYERDRQRFIRKCLKQRATVVQRIEFTRCSMRYDSDPELGLIIRDGEQALDAIDHNLRQAGHIIN